MDFDIVTFGPLVVEIEGGQIGQRFDQAGIYHGPFSSGATPTISLLSTWPYIRLPT